MREGPSQGGEPFALAREEALTNVGGFPARGTRHVEDALALCRGEGHDRQEAASTLENVVAREVLWGGADRDGRVKDDEADLGPLAEGLEVHAAVDEGLGEVPTASLEGVCADDGGAWDFIGLEKLEGLEGPWRR